MSGRTRITKGSQRYAQVTDESVEVQPAAALEEVEAAGWDVPDRKEQTAEQEEREAPKWFEHRFFKWLDRPRVTYPVSALLVLTPFLTSLGSFAEVWYGCPTISAHIEGMYVAMGTGEQQPALDHPLDHPSNQG